MIQWVLAATLVCGASVFTACTDNADPPIVKGPKPYTGGCISFDEDRMIEILQNCDMSLVITIKE